MRTITTLLAISPATRAARSLPTTCCSCTFRAFQDGSNGKRFDVRLVSSRHLTVGAAQNRA